MSAVACLSLPLPLPGSLAAARDDLPPFGTLPAIPTTHWHWAQPYHHHPLSPTRGAQPQVSATLRSIRSPTMHHGEMNLPFP
ncbi:MAG: hypothetical protein VX699_11270, partial [Myxococcota bacterium]|nr:hypothetical protein [Myxococcota bacterium]